jgi:hypothetical protein
MSVVFDPTTLGDASVLSNGLLTVASTAETGDQGAFGTAPMAAGGKYYFEMTMVAATSFATGAGFGQKFDITSGDLWNGISAACIGIVTGFSGDSQVVGWPDTTGVDALGTITAGSVLGFAVDLINNRAWFKIGAGHWNASPSATPATPATGIDISAMAGVPLYPFASVTVFQDTITANFIATPPAGFTVIPAAAPTPALPAAPMVFLSWSDDRGHTWGNPVGVSMGGLGEYLTSLQWQRLGLARDRVFALEWSSPTRTCLLGAWIDATPAQS